jgi:wyosine [tRNA(Phe)-imidazoG37] synthetase (radical SAM superfamily)
MKYQADDIVKSCPKLESGLRFGPEGIRACQLGPFAAPLYWNEEEAAALSVTKDMIILKRKELFNKLNDDTSELICKKCSMMVEKRYAEVDFTRLGRIDHAPRTICNLRCNFCGFTHAEKAGDEKNGFIESQYESLKFLKVFTEADVLWDAAVDFNGGETSLLKNLDEYLNYFRKMKITILCFSNAVKYSESMALALRDGVIQWLVVSVDAGCSSTYHETKKLDVYPKVLENLSKYASMGSGAGGSLAVKYIFTDDNCSDDDIFGFVYAMLAIQPQKIWLTFDFTPFIEIAPDSEDFLHYDFSKQIKAYAKMYLTFRKHGLEPVHYTEGHLAKISKAGARLLRETLLEIDRLSLRLSKPDSHRSEMIIKSFRGDPVEEKIDTNVSSWDEILYADVEDLAGQLEDRLGTTHNICIAPASETAKKIAALLSGKRQIRILDKNINLHGRVVEGATLSSYEALLDQFAQVVVVISPEQHRKAIQRTINDYSGEDTVLLMCKNK